MDTSVGRRLDENVSTTVVVAMIWSSASCLIFLFTSVTCWSASEFRSDSVFKSTGISLITPLSFFSALVLEHLTWNLPIDESSSRLLFWSSECGWTKRSPLGAIFKSNGRPTNSWSAMMRVFLSLAEREANDLALPQTDSMTGGPL